MPGAIEAAQTGLDATAGGTDHRFPGFARKRQATTGGQGTKHDRAGHRCAGTRSTGDVEGHTGQTVLTHRAQQVLTIAAAIAHLHAFGSSEAARGGGDDQGPRRIEHAIAGMARENSGTVEQTAGAAHDLKRLADGLAALVGRFKV
ncbi:hypothetical protein SDC9_163209 [bioreactor metagenome]|uniref:Uncharacterized protein n=1 Tax=bioreactor metagenome TaxID=1076179 RepID=A0A645FV04_9ZZZZ